MPVDAILTTAATALGATLTDPVDLGGSARSTVLRCRTSHSDDSLDGTVIVKAHTDHDTFATEAAGLAHTTAGPRLLATDNDHSLIVMSVLGAGPTLVDRLLDDHPEPAADALLAWAAAYGHIAAETHGRETELATRRARYTHTPDEPYRLDTNAFHTFLDTLAIPHPDLSPITTLTGPAVFSPGDICADNNILTPDGCRVLDFEGAGYHCVHLDAAYTTMPFSTCWCVYRLPTTLHDTLAATYRDAAATAIPELLDEQAWRRGPALATAWWTIDITAALGARASQADRPMHSTRRPVPTMRELLRHRWHEATRIPEIADTTHQLLAATEHWRTEPLPLYPAFAG